MQAIRSQNTKIEIMLGKALWKSGHRYRKNDKNVLGKPDFTFKRYKIVVFCDSEFWHGKNWKHQQKRIGTNQKFWIEKIQNNIKRDRRVNRGLKKQGWVVLRFWETDIKKNLPKCLAKIEMQINSVKQVPYNNLKIPQ